MSDRARVRKRREWRGRTEVVGDSVPVGVGVGVALDESVPVDVGEGVGVELGDGVMDGESETVADGVDESVPVGVGVGVGVALGDGESEMVAEGEDDGEGEGETAVHAASPALDQKPSPQGVQTTLGAEESELRGSGGEREWRRGGERVGRWAWRRRRPRSAGERCDARRRRRHYSPGGLALAGVADAVHAALVAGAVRAVRAGQRERQREKREDAQRHSRMMRSSREPNLERVCNCSRVFWRVRRRSFVRDVLDWLAVAWRAWSWSLGVVKCVSSASHSLHPTAPRSPVMATRAALLRLWFTGDSARWWRLDPAFDASLRPFLALTDALVAGAPPPDEPEISPD